MGFLHDRAKAEALARRVLVKAFRKLSRLKHNSLFSSYLLGLLRKELRDQGLAEAPPGLSNLWLALAGLPRVQREVVFFFFQGFDVHDIARLRREPYAQSRARFTKALAHISRKTVGRDAPDALPPDCLRQELTFLLAAREAAQGERNRAETHLQLCAACKQRMSRTTRLFEMLEKEISPHVLPEPLLNGIPGPSRIWAFGGAAAAMLAAAGVFFALWFACGELVVPIRELPSGRVVVVDHRPP